MGIVSHDLRNPLSVDPDERAPARRVSELTPKQQLALARLVSSTARANRLIADLLDFTAAGSGRGLAGRARKRSTCTRWSPRRVEDLRVAFPDASHRASHGRARARASASGDRLAQLIGNLVANAIAYGAPDRPVTVTSSIDPERVLDLRAQRRRADPARPAAAAVRADDARRRRRPDTAAASASACSSCARSRTRTAARSGSTRPPRTGRRSGPASRASRRLGRCSAIRASEPPSGADELERFRQSELERLAITELQEVALRRHHATGGRDVRRADRPHLAGRRQPPVVQVPRRPAGHRNPARARVLRARDPDPGTGVHRRGRRGRIRASLAIRWSPASPGSGSMPARPWSPAPARRWARCA